jgi:ribosomal protein RSM22 (predicted rRNA methylase)
MVEIPPDMRVGLEAALSGSSVRELSLAVDRLMHQYRSGGIPDSTTLAADTDVAAYATYRMPATYGAVRTVLDHLLRLWPRYEPATHLDVGGGTGAAVWASSHALSTLKESMVIDRAGRALDLGRRIAARADAPTVRQAQWRRGALETGDLPHADLVTASYVLGELPEPQRSDLVDRICAVGRTVILIEPGTPQGYQRIVKARTQLIDAGLQIVAPCPHDRPCPLAGGDDWCHFAVRVNRSSLHRQVKRAELGYEDEKFSYVVASWHGPASAPGRVIRHPVTRKGLVALTVCSEQDGIETSRVSKRQGAVYRAARGKAWGDSWSPLPRKPTSQSMTGD